MEWRPSELKNAGNYPPIGLGSQGLGSGRVVLMYGIYCRRTCPSRARGGCEIRSLWRRGAIHRPSGSAHLSFSTSTKHDTDAVDVQLKSRTSFDRSIWPTDCSKASSVNSRVTVYGCTPSPSSQPRTTHTMQWQVVRGWQR